VIDPPQDLKLRYGQRTVRVAYRVNGQLEQQEFSLDGLADNADFLTALRNNRIETIHSQETTLERVFIRVTGKELV
jgi:fluoroquinolone transport system ATP-binding protein